MHNAYRVPLTRFRALEHCESSRNFLIRLKLVRFARSTFLPRLGEFLRFQPVFRKSNRTGGVLRTVFDASGVLIPYNFFGALLAVVLSHSSRRPYEWRSTTSARSPRL